MLTKLVANAFEETAEGAQQYILGGHNSNLHVECRLTIHAFVGFEIGGRIT